MSFSLHGLHTLQPHLVHYPPLTKPQAYWPSFWSLNTSRSFPAQDLWISNFHGLQSSHGWVPRALHNSREHQLHRIIWMVPLELHYVTVLAATLSMRSQCKCCIFKEAITDHLPSPPASTWVSPAHHLCFIFNAVSALSETVFIFYVFFQLKCKIHESRNLACLTPMMPLAFNRWCALNT